MTRGTSHPTAWFVLYVTVIAIAVLWAVRWVQGATYQDYEGPDCCWCASTENLNVHHVKPQSRGGGDTADNLLTFCRRCHLVVGHAGNWKNEVPNLKQIVKLRRENVPER